jgi:hypothetical protein
MLWLWAVYSMTVTPVRKRRKWMRENFGSQTLVGLSRPGVFSGNRKFLVGTIGIGASLAIVAIFPGTAVCLNFLYPPADKPSEGTPINPQTADAIGEIGWRIVVVVGVGTIL